MFSSKRKIALHICANILCVTAFTFAASASEEGIDILIEACKHSGENPTLIKSIYVEAEEIIGEKTLTAERFEQIKMEMTRDYQRIYATDPQTLERELLTIPDFIEKQNREQKMQSRFLLRIKDTIRHVSRSSTRRWNNDTNKWEGWQTLVYQRADRGRGEKEISFQAEHEGRVVEIDNTAYSVPPYHLFGRIRGATEAAVSLGLLGDRLDYSKYDFLPENIKRFKETVAKAERTTGSTFCKNVGKTKYDNDVECVILETFSGGVVIERYWIDTNRGHTCPLIQLCHPDTGNLAQEYIAKDFFQHADSGMWYPAQYSEIIYEKEKGKIRSKKNYIIDKTTFKLNQPIADEEFSIDVVEGAWVNDTRDGKNAPHRATEPGTLSLAKGGLDLEKMAWLHAGPDMPVDTEAAEAYKKQQEEWEKERQARIEEVNREMVERTKKDIEESDERYRLWVEEEKRKQQLEREEKLRLEREERDRLEREKKNEMSNLPAKAEFSYFRVTMFVLGIIFIAFGFYLNHRQKKNNGK